MTERVVVGAGALSTCSSLEMGGIDAATRSSSSPMILTTGGHRATLAKTSLGERLVAVRPAMAIGLGRRGSGAIWKRYVGPPALPEDPAEQDRFLSRYTVHRRDVEDVVNQMLGRDPEQHRAPRLSWGTLIQLLADHGLDLTEGQLIAVAFDCEFSPELQSQLASDGT